MCEIIKSNFDENFPIIDDAICRSQFIAIDTEFSGLSATDEDRGNLFDNGERRYKKLRRSIQKFTVTQIGLSAFSKDKYENTYHAQSFNCYLHPMAFGSMDVRFLCQTSSLQFLSQYNFDFNKFVYEGVPFVNEEQERELTVVNQDQHCSRWNDVFPSSKGLQQCCVAVSNWIKAAKEGEVLTLDTPANELDYWIEVNLNLSYPGIWTKVVDNKVLVTKVSADERLKLEAEDQADSRMLGFTRVFRSLVKHKKPMVGHNCLMDLMFMYDKFYRSLPASYTKFKADIHALFPFVIDTKHLSSCMRQMPDCRESGLFSATGLSQLYDTMHSAKGKLTVLYSPTIQHAPISERYKTVQCPHEAGYDAYMCGYVFIRMAHFLAAQEIKCYEPRAMSFAEYLSAVNPYANAVNIIRAEVQYALLNGKDSPAERLHWLHVQSRSPRLTRSNLAELLDQYGSVDVWTKGTQSAVLAVKGHRSAREILETYRQNDLIEVSRYNPLRHNAKMRSALWVGAAMSGVVCAWVVWSGFRSNPT